MCAFFNIDEDAIDDFKATTFDHGLRGRDWMIGLSEVVTKPVMGQHWFGVQAANEVLKHENQNRFVVSDAGFTEEVQVFMKTLRQSGQGHFTFWMWHVHRPGHSFAGDSRDYVFVKSCKPEMIDNNGDLDDLHHQVDELLCFND